MDLSFSAATTRGRLPGMRTRVCETERAPAQSATGRGAQRNEVRAGSHVRSCCAARLVAVALTSSPCADLLGAQDAGGHLDPEHMHLLIDERRHVGHSIPGVLRLIGQEYRGDLLPVV